MKIKRIIRKLKKIKFPLSLFTLTDIKSSTFIISLSLLLHNLKLIYFIHNINIAEYRICKLNDFLLKQKITNTGKKC